MLNGGLIKGAAKNGLTSLFKLMETTRPRLEDEKAADVLKAVLEDSGYIKMWENDKSPDAAGKIENIKELIGDIKSRFDSFDEFLEYVSLVTDNDMTAGETGNYVSVMTLHAAKGLEFDTVFLPGWEEEIFPHRRALDEGGIKALEEERRLAYVGITRARKKSLFLMRVPASFSDSIKRVFRPVLFPSCPANISNRKISRILTRSAKNAAALPEAMTTKIMNPKIRTTVSFAAKIFFLAFSRRRIRRRIFRRIPQQQR